MTQDLHRHFHDELNQVKVRLLTMSGEAEAALGLAVEALLERDAEKARRVIAGDRIIDTMEMEVEERHTSPPGSVHGGILCDIADAAMGCAYGTLLDDSESWTTIELKINYLRPAFPGAKLVAEGRVVNAGRTLALTECDVRNGEGKLVARALSTVMRITASS